MPAALRTHVRYPEDLFVLQAGVYATYHMIDPEVFYNREDLWSFPQESYGGEPVTMQPYYTIMRLPGESREEFILMLPMVPSNRDNMIAWLAARCDGSQYGSVIEFAFPKEELVFGPAQIEARIDQDTTISQQLSLWNQIGSRVIRGNLLVIPIDDALLYVEPLYLRAEQRELPELKFVHILARKGGERRHGPAGEVLGRIADLLDDPAAGAPGADVGQRGTYTASHTADRVTPDATEGAEQLLPGHHARAPQPGALGLLRHRGHLRGLARCDDGERPDASAPRRSAKAAPPGSPGLLPAFRHGAP